MDPSRRHDVMRSLSDVDLLLRFMDEHDGKVRCAETNTDWGIGDFRSVRRTVGAAAKLGYVTAKDGKLGRVRHLDVLFTDAGSRRAAELLREIRSSGD